MRAFIAIVAVFALLAPGLATARAEREYTNKQRCRRMTRQIDHFENDVLKRAEDRGNVLWANSTLQHIDRLKNRRADTCPEWGKQRTALVKAKEQADKAKRMLKRAAKTAARYFAGGLF